jgi:hypothetical protein
MRSPSPRTAATFQNTTILPRCFAPAAMDPVTTANRGQRPDRKKAAVGDLDPAGARILPMVRGSCSRNHALERGKQYFVDLVPVAVAGNRGRATAEVFVVDVP